ncbi:hypothetical protein [Romboutsia sp.]|uniref:hypothetical protein n=1 Tax=Romboutsia sp. TaxID=1965302 RepID=UPI002D7F9E12|nr:hypothetical protein [Romboutsia sp.]
MLSIDIKKVVELALTIMIYYILIFVATLATIISIAIGGTYTIKGILGIIFAISCILRCKSENRNIAVNLAYWISSIIIVSSFVLEQFLK